MVEPGDQRELADLAQVAAELTPLGHQPRQQHLVVAVGIGGELDVARVGLGGEAAKSRRHPMRQADHLALPGAGVDLFLDSLGQPARRHGDLLEAGSEL